MGIAMPSKRDSKHSLDRNLLKKYQLCTALLVLSHVELVLSQAACHIWGGVDICCENGGYGPNCAYCPSGECNG